ncbi:MAG TPA: NAD(P)H-dependent oxidoreductase [Oscillospiraceae bacterium]|nr:NAD(P)H-dependent oxidoreductase [Oscillospiraceae bacterium]HPS35763.1 NAD(P)H-dependent oxidoreductase [Oscillospiraceae bacterium]
MDNLMKIAVVHGQTHKGVTYGMTSTFLRNLMGTEDELTEFFLPKDGPDFCYGCYNCFLKSEEKCPSANKVQPIAKALEQADVIVLDTPDYVMEMSGAMKNLMDHLAYRWFSHRPHGAMFLKVGVTICSSAGAPTANVTKSMARQLKWIGVPKVYRFGLACQTAPGEKPRPEKQAQIDRKAEKLAKAVRRRAEHPHTGLRIRFMFWLFKGMQTDDKTAWNPVDRDWWIRQGWTKKTKPWKNS